MSPFKSLHGGVKAGSVVTVSLSSGFCWRTIKSHTREKRQLFHLTIHFKSTDNSPASYFSKLFESQGIFISVLEAPTLTVSQGEKSICWKTLEHFQTFSQDFPPARHLNVVVESSFFVKSCSEYWHEDAGVWSLLKEPVGLTVNWSGVIGSSGFKQMGSGWETCIIFHI